MSVVIDASFKSMIDKSIRVAKINIPDKMFKLLEDNKTTLEMLQVDHNTICVYGIKDGTDITSVVFDPKYLNRDKEAFQKLFDQLLDIFEPAQLQLQLETVTVTTTAQ